MGMAKQPKRLRLAAIKEGVRTFASRPAFCVPVTGFAKVVPQPTFRALPQRDAWKRWEPAGREPIE